ncbi:hypothetical protein TTHERM_00628400 (macronuclear) [Tetrahymena thermophila SB210]|uniref:C2H2-type domain-containing protein n=1 Tax=Tetrahymena thermophila (strain SB210) TaxID=312017 RepID=Q23RV8_TETTS|nr:hypothetical protein TTHERM_00628400 [Tetrahymena thermophila SB210]EAR99281.4 hypothetical protein TTHERM_00628400 [Tetrahymena thermophila SB210]|eukprot:XP_001019526.4 hypothetical protein TTHERM_00628400 [Tetrahymena thermophila SB210]
MGDRDFRKQCLQCKRMIPQLHVCISQSCEEKFMTLICEQCHKDIHDHQKIHEKKDNVKQISLDEFLLQIEGMIDRQNQIEKEGKSEDILNLVSQINDSVNTIDDIVSRLQGVKSNLLTIKEQVSNPSAQAKTIHQNLQIQSSSSYQQIIQNLQQLKGFAQFEDNTLVLKDLKQTNIVHEVAQTQTRVNNILQILQQSSQQTQQQQQLTKDALKSQAIEKVNQHIKQLNLNISFNSFVSFLEISHLIN